MPVIDETCQRCGEFLRYGQRITTKYCGVRCRVAAFRERRRIKAETMARYARQWPPTVIDDPSPTRIGAPSSRAPTLVDDIDRWLQAPIVLDYPDEP